MKKRQKIRTGLNLNIQLFEKNKKNIFRFDPLVSVSNEVSSKSHQWNVTDSDEGSDYEGLSKVFENCPYLLNYCYFSRTETIIFARVKNARRIQSKNTVGVA